MVVDLAAAEAVDLAVEAVVLADEVCNFCCKNQFLSRILLI